MATGIADLGMQRWSGKIPISRKERRELFGQKSISAKRPTKALRLFERRMPISSPRDKGRSSTTAWWCCFDILEGSLLHSNKAIINLSHKSVQSLHTFPDEKPEVYNRTLTSGGEVFSRLPQPVTSTTRNMEHGPHNSITNRITCLRSNIEHGRKALLVIKMVRTARRNGFHSINSNVSRWFTASSASWARDSSSLTFS